MNEFLDSWNAKNNKIVVVAGVFDPVHKGHISAANEALRYGKKVIMLPERKPWRKTPGASYEHRLAMLRIATENEPDIEIVDYPEDCFRITQTFSWLRARYKTESFVWLMGSDSVQYVGSWSGADKLAQVGVSNIAVIRRYDDDRSVRFSDVHSVPVRYLVRPMRKHEKLSSTFIKADLRHRHTALPKGVYEYIRQNGLYEFCDSSSVK